VLRAAAAGSAARSGHGHRSKGERLSLLGAVTATVALAAVAGCAGTRSLAVDGWVTYWKLPDGIADLGGPARGVSDVFLFVVHLDATGNPVPARRDQDYARTVEAVATSGATAWLTIVNDVVDASGRATPKVATVVHDVLVDPDRRRAHRERIVAIARAHGVTGVDIDYERLLAADRELFSIFVAELRTDLQAAGMRLSVTVQPKTRESRADGPGAADWAALCRSADRLQIMLYNEHSAKTEPGPVATPSWMDEVLRFASNQCPADKIVPAIKVIGIEWAPEGTHDVPYSEAMAVSSAEDVPVNRHADGEVPWFAYGPDTARCTVYYEDARSLRIKLLTVLRRGARRVVLWNLAEVSPELWTGIGDLIRPSFAATPRSP
jgi:spore germination protein YaaH